MNLFDAVIDSTAARSGNGTPQQATAARTPPVSEARNGKPLAEIIGTIQAEGRTRTDAIVDTRKIHVDVCPTQDDDICLTVDAGLAGFDNRPLPMTRHAHSQVASSTGVPWKYYQRMMEDQPRLLAENVRTWFESEPKRRLIRTVGTRDRIEEVNPEVRAFLSDRYLPLDHPRFLATVLEEAGNLGATPTRSFIDPDRLHVELMTERHQQIPNRKRGDVVRQGITIRNSEVGDGSLQIVPFLVRLVCVNGMTGITRYRRTHLGSRNTAGILSRETVERQAEAVWSEVRDWTRLALDPERLDEVLVLMGEASKTDAPDDAVVVAANLADTLALSQLEAYKVFDSYRQEEDFTHFGVTQAVTRVAQEVDSFERAKELEDAGSKLLQENGEKLARKLARNVPEKRIESALGASMTALRA